MMIGKIDYSLYFEQLFQKILKPLWEARQATHGNSWAGRTGIKGILTQLERKQDRLYNAIWEGELTPEKKREAMEQVKDMAVYAMALYIALDVDLAHPFLEYD